MSAARDQVCISSIDWGYLWQGPQEVMTCFARDGGRVLFVENTGIRRPRPRDWRRIVGRARDAFAGAPRGAARLPERGITVTSPVVVPLPWSRLARAVNRRLFTDRLPRRAAALGLRDPVMWSFLPTPHARRANGGGGRARHDDGP